MTRSFLPVGQGAFYVERFHNSGGHRDNIVVYDCGSTSKICVERAIKRAFASKKANDNRKVVIDALFISHLHYDHISGIEALLERCEVKRIYLPYTTPEEREFLWAGSVVEEVCSETDFVANLILNPTSTIRTSNGGDDVEIIEVSEYGDDRDVNRRDNESRRAGSRTVQSCKDVCNTWDEFAEAYKWHYIPCTLKQRDRLSELKELLNVKTGREIVAMWKRSDDDAKRVKKAYQDVAEQGDLNDTTLVLYSGGCCWRVVSRLSCNSERCIDRCLIYNGCRYLNRNGCLYMGDCNANKHCKVLHRCNIDVFNIGLVQVPHHGSRASFSSQLTNFDADFVISAGSNNTYGHPSEEVVTEIHRCDRTLHIVSDCLSSEFVQVLDFQGV